MFIRRIEPLETQTSLRKQEAQLTKEAWRRGMELRIFDNTAVVNTDEAQWLILECAGGFQLYHENVSCTNERYRSGYHLQDNVCFDNPVSILGYIYNHDIAHVKRYSERYRGA